MTKSALTDVTILSPNGYFPRAYGIRKVTIHHMAGVMTAEQCGYVFQNASRQASSNYGIGNDGRIGCYVEEENAAWTSSSWDNDNQAITIEVSNSYAGGDWPISDAAWQSMIKLCADICTRYGIEPCCDDTINGSTFTFHRWFAATGCPGDYIYSRRQQIIAEVKAAMGNTGGWVYDEKRDNWWYQYADGTYAVGWAKIVSEKHGAEWYYFDAKGWLVTGWLDWNGKRYYLQPKTKKTGTHYGYMVTGSKKINGKYYYFMPGDDGSMISDTFRQAASGNWYAYGKDGARIMDDARITVNAKTGAIAIE